jgi:hypothetical protein
VDLVAFCTLFHTLAKDAHHRERGAFTPFNVTLLVVERKDFSIAGEYAICDELSSMTSCTE